MYVLIDLQWNKQNKGVNEKQTTTKKTKTSKRGKMYQVYNDSKKDNKANAWKFIGAESDCVAAHDS